MNEDCKDSSSRYPRNCALAVVLDGAVTVADLDFTKHDANAEPEFSSVARDFRAQSDFEQLLVDTQLKTREEGEYPTPSAEEVEILSLLNLWGYSGFGGDAGPALPTADELLTYWCWYVVGRIWEKDCDTTEERLTYARRIVREALQRKGAAFPAGKWETIRRGALRGRSYRSNDPRTGHGWVWVSDGGLDLTKRRGVAQYTWAERSMVALMRDALDPTQAQRKKSDLKALKAAKVQARRAPDKLQPSQAILVKIAKFQEAKSDKGRAWIAGQIVFSRALTILNAHWVEANALLEAERLVEALNGDLVAHEYLPLVDDPHGTVVAVLDSWNPEEGEAARERAAAGGRNSSNRKIQFSDYLEWKMDQPDDVSRSEEAKLLKVATATISRYRAKMRTEIERSAREVL